jgi:hypothetical protein
VGEGVIQRYAKLTADARDRGWGFTDPSSFTSMFKNG